MGMAEMGTSPIVVLATTFASPLKSTVNSEVRVTPAKSWAKAALFNDRSGMFVNEIGRSTVFPVDTPPLAGAMGISS